MSKNISIQEAGVASSFSGIDKLRTTLIGGGSANWVPEDSITQAVLNVSENGTYDAADSGYHSFSKVVVNVEQLTPSNSIVGIGEDGNAYEFTVDEDGAIIETKIPSSIVVTTNPTKTEYKDLEQIDYTGIVVTAYDADGNSMGQVPFDELTFTVHNAALDSVEERYCTSNLETNWPQPIKTCKYAMHEINHDSWGVNTWHKYDATANDSAYILVEANGVYDNGSNNPNGGGIFTYGIASPYSGAVGTSNSYNRYQEPFTETSSINTYTSFTHDGKTVHIAAGNGYSGGGASTLLAAVPEQIDYGVLPWPDNNTFWTAIYGEATGSGGQNIPVYWTRPGGDVLSASFTITVSYSFSGSGGGSF